jgi:hypothetical protein
VGTASLGRHRQKADWTRCLVRPLRERWVVGGPTAAQLLQALGDLGDLVALGQRPVGLSELRRILLVLGGEDPDTRRADLRGSGEVPVFSLIRRWKLLRLLKEVLEPGSNHSADALDRCRSAGH